MLRIAPEGDYPFHMVDQTPAEVHAGFIVAGTTADFQANLSLETEDGKYEILAALLADQFGNSNAGLSHIAVVPKPLLARSGKRDLRS